MEGCQVDRLGIYPLQSSSERMAVWQGIKLSKLHSH